MEQAGNTQQPPNHRTWTAAVCRIRMKERKGLLYRIDISSYQHILMASPVNFLRRRKQMSPLSSHGMGEQRAGVYALYFMSGAEA